jgi:hypothetical protein
MNYRESIEKFTVKWFNDPAQMTMEFHENNILSFNETTLSEHLYHTLVNQIRTYYGDPVVIKLMYVLQLRPSEKYGDSMVSFHSSYTERERSKRVICSYGKLLKRIFPDINQKLLTELVSKYNDKFSVGELILNSGKDRSDFRKAYQGPYSTDTNFTRTSDFKSLCNSCMGGNEWGDTHPAEAYASGDFTMVWVEEQGTNKVAARCVVMTHLKGEPLTRWRPAPIYVTSTDSKDLITNFLDTRSPGWHFESSWIGAVMLKIERDSRVFMPYLDYGEGIEDRGDYFTVGGPLNPDGGSGYLDSHYCCCENCGIGVNEDESYAHNDNQYCESCYNENIFCCENCDDSYWGYDGMEQVQGGRYGEQHFCRHCVSRCAVFVEESSEWWTVEKVIELANGKYITKDMLETGEWAEASDDQMVYPTEELGVIEGEWYTIEWLEAEGYTLTDEGEWKRPLEILMEKEDAKVS